MEGRSRARQERDGLAAPSENMFASDTTRAPEGERAGDPPQLTSPPSELRLGSGVPGVTAAGVPAVVGVDPTPSAMGGRVGSNPSAFRVPDPIIANEGDEDTAVPSEEPPPLELLPTFKPPVITNTSGK